jgi:intein/homing endonuclease
MSRNLKLHAAQMMVYNSKARFRCVAAGRRFGKCLASDTLISMADGSEKMIQNIKADDLVLTINENTYELECRPVTHVLDNGVKETVIVKTSRRTLRCTPNHPILVNNKWIEADDLKAGDLVAVPKTLVFGDKRMPEHVVDFLAIWLAEGSKYSISNTTPEILDVVRESIKSFDNGLMLQNICGKGVDWRVTNGDRSGGPQKGSNNSVRLMLEDFGLWGKTSKTKFIPDEIFQLPEDQLARFLNLFFACDGCVTKKSKNTWAIECGLANELMVNQISRLLHKFGIRGSVYHRVHKAKSSVTNIRFESWNYVSSNPSSVCIFAEKIGCLSKEKQLSAAVADMTSKRVNTNEYLPITHDDFAKHLNYEPVSKGKYGGHNALVARDLPDDLRKGLTTWRKQTPSRVSRYRYEKLREYSDGFFNPIVDGDLAWEEIISVEQAEPCQTWDLSVDNNHNFVSNGIITHNTILSKTLMIKYAVKPRSKVWYVAPTYRMAKQIMWQDLQDSIPAKWIRKINDTTLTIWLVNGSTIELKGADSPDSLRGVGLDFLVLDEFQDMTEDTWKKVLRPTLADRQGHALFIGSPKGFSYFYEIYLMGQDLERSRANQWMSWQFPTIVSPFIPKEEIEAARQDMDEKSFEQEFCASFLNMAGRVYYAFDRRVHVKKCPFNPSLPIWVGQDFNIDPMSTSIMQPQPNGEVWIVDEIVKFSSNTEESVDEIERRFYRYRANVTIFPDPAGNARQHARGETDLDIFRERGFKRIKHRRKHPAIADRVNCVNRLFRAADGGVRLYIDENCRNTIESFDQTVYKKGTRDIDKSMNIEHLTDSTGYCLELQFPMRKIEIAGLSL